MELRPPQVVRCRVPVSKNRASSSNGKEHKKKKKAGAWREGQGAMKRYRGSMKDHNAKGQKG